MQNKSFSAKDLIAEAVEDVVTQSVSTVKQSEEGVIQETSDLTKRDIVWLSDLTKNDISIAGGKGANLAEMYNLKLPVPPAFIVTANAYQRFIESTGLKDRINQKLKLVDVKSTKVLEFKAKQIRDMILESEIPLKLAVEIKKSYEDLDVNKDILKHASGDALKILKSARDPAFVAVRSSATTEDLVTASFAGQQDTYLNVKGPSKVLDHVKKCWASLFTARAIYYRETKGF